MRGFDPVRSRGWIFLMMITVLLTAVVSACSGNSGHAPADTSAPTMPSAADKPAAATSKELKTAQDVATYEGNDREQRLVEAAKKEGEVSIYTSMALEDMQALAQDFEKKYGVKAKIWRSSSENVLQRVVTEASANRFEADIVETNGPEIEAIHREKLLQEVNSPYLKDLIPEAILPHKEWVATRLNIFVQSYNTNKVKKEELPQTWEDLLDPKWKGRLAIEESDSDWFAEVVKLVGEEKGIKLFKDISSTNGLSVRKGHTLLAQLVASGEVPFALTVYNYKAEQLKSKGAPVDWFAIGTAIARPNGVGVTKKAPHPNAAVLFYDFMISEAQKQLLEKDFVPTSKLVKTPLSELKMKFVNPAVVLDEKAKWDKLYEELLKSGKNK